LVLVAVSAFSTEARADRGALTLDLGGGATVHLLPAPYTSGAAPLPTTSWLSRVGLRYGISDELEVAFSGFFEPRVGAYHHRVTVDTTRPGFPGPDAGRGLFSGTLVHTFQRFGLAVGARRVWGSILRFHLGGDLGWTYRAYGQFDHFDTSGARTRSHGLRLEGFAASNVMLAPVVGLEWAFHDKWSLSVMPRIELLVGPDPMVSFLFPVLLSTSWYI